MPNTEHDLSKFDMVRQPDDVTCGPTCLHAIYRYYGDDRSLDTLSDEIETVDGGGTVGVHLALHALASGYRAKITSWNLRVFDPTWFAPGAPPAKDRLAARATAQRGTREGDRKLRDVCEAYVKFLELGGEVELDDLDAALLRGYLKRGVPILTGLSATFLYREARELADGTSDDVRGDPSGHFVVLTGYDQETREVTVTDPMHPNPLSPIHTYRVPMSRLIGAIYLGVLTYDANLLVIEPKAHKRPGPPPVAR
jgi:Peptidase_C39 like family/Peptidase C39 family